MSADSLKDKLYVAEIALDIPARVLEGSFTYLIPDGMDVEIGQSVKVTFGHRPAIGYVLDVSYRDPDEFNFKLNYIEAVLSKSWFDEISASIARWISKEYLGTLSESVKLFLPPRSSPRFKKAKDGTWQYIAPSVAAVDDRWVSLTSEGLSYEPDRRSTKQRAVIDALLFGEMRVTDLSIEIGNVSNVLKTLEQKGVVKIEYRRKIRGLEKSADRSSAIKELTEGQVSALKVIHEAFEAQDGQVVVVDGVTGSGKTEVYLQAISEVIAAGKTACVLVPEISLTPQTVGRFRSRFGDLVAVLHSRLSYGERFDQWSLIREGKARVVVGARSALFAPLQNLGLIVIDEEHESSYKQGSSPRYHSREVAAKIAKARGATLVLGSASPSIETLHNCEIGRYKKVILPKRASGRELPTVEIVDLAKEFSDGNRSMLSRALSEALLENARKHQKSVLLLNRRGFASFLLCRECGFVPECPSCSTSLTFHGGHKNRENFLMCHHCGHKEPVLSRCPQCQSPYLRQLGPGTQFAFDQIQALLGSDVPIIRMDADTTSKKGAHEKLLNEFAAAKGGVLLGTQMIAKGLDFPDVTLAGVLIADTTLKLPDFKAGERTFQLIEQVAGRAGRADKPGRVIVQTYWPDHPAIKAAAVHDREMFLKAELPLRKEAGYPPYRRLLNILIWGSKDEEVAKTAEDLSLELRNKTRYIDDPNFEILGPSPCLLSKLRGVWRWHIVLKGSPNADLPALVSDILNRRHRTEHVSVAADCDPVDLF